MSKDPGAAAVAIAAAMCELHFDARPMVIEFLHASFALVAVLRAVGLDQPAQAAVAAGAGRGEAAGAGGCNGAACGCDCGAIAAAGRAVIENGELDVGRRVSRGSRAVLRIRSLIRLVHVLPVQSQGAHERLGDGRRAADAQLRGLDGLSERRGGDG
jgi:hypothetical protein